MKELNDREVEKILSDKSFANYMDYDMIVQEQNGTYAVTYTDGMICTDDMSTEQLNEFFKEMVTTL